MNKNRKCLKMTKKKQKRKKQYSKQKEKKGMNNFS